jgi:hypothetical protein
LPAVIKLKVVFLHTGHVNQLQPDADSYKIAIKAFRNCL